MILLPNTPSSNARSRTRFASVNSLRNEPIHLGFGSPSTLFRVSLQLPWLNASRMASVAPMAAALLLHLYRPSESVNSDAVTQLRAAYEPQDTPSGSPARMRLGYAPAGRKSRI